MNIQYGLALESCVRGMVLFVCPVHVWASRLRLQIKVSSYIDEGLCGRIAVVTKCARLKCVSV